MELKGIDERKHDEFPYSGLRVLGSVQAGIGAVCVLLGSLDLALTLIPRDTDRWKYINAPAQETVYDTVVTLTIASCPLWCGMWFIISGAVGTCVSRIRSHSLVFFRNTFLTLSLLCATVFGPSALAVSSYEAFLRHSLEESDYRWVMPLLVMFLALLEVILAVISAAMCCCCSPVQLTKVHVVYTSPTKETRPQNVYLLEPWSTRLPEQNQPIKALPAPEPEQPRERTPEQRWKRQETPEQRWRREPTPEQRWRRPETPIAEVQPESEVYATPPRTQRDIETNIQQEPYTYQKLKKFVFPS